VKRLEELLPQILTQLGPESMDYLRSYAESMGALKPKSSNIETINEGDEEEEDDEVPDLVENFEEAAAK
jgi:nascent polypeptide-associated complex subunit beta